ncbi:MAG TPA: enoyl-CoA hydratase/isomerase family protein [Solirubrobacteraceae bacterium]|jgi:enoyl-CoA hydratase/carnithine racemase|nr:enoyl-CoA hydratase/isomerase family protein [Solirubrobacteraceae bacterium]
MDELLHIDRRGPAALVTLNRPEKRNALSIDLRTALAEALEQLAAEEAVAAIGLTGAGSAFCAGMDVSQFGGDAEHKQRLVQTSVRCFSALATCPKPTVALVNGPAIAGGFALALLCDVRVAGPGASFGFPELGRHIPPSFAAAMAALPPALARDLCLTGRLLSAQEALAAGVVSRISEDDSALQEVAGAPPAATAEIKRRILLAGAGAGWLELLEAEQQALRAALL